jgi:hypothetical protein
MKIIEINVTKKDHLKSLVMDFRRAGFQLVTFGYEFSELENEDEFVKIKVVK